MKIRDFVKQISLPIFTLEQARRVLPESERDSLAVQLNRWVGSKELYRLKRGIYIVAGRKVDEMVVAGFLYPGSYVSLETVLNTSGIIPDIPGQVASVVTGRPRIFTTSMGVFAFSKIATKLYFGFEIEFDSMSGLNYLRAKPEKALLDYIYLRRARDLRDTRISWDKLDKASLVTMAKDYPAWVQKEVAKYV